MTNAQDFRMLSTHSAAMVSILLLLVAQKPHQRTEASHGTATCRFWVLTGNPWQSRCLLSLSPRIDPTSQPSRSDCVWPYHHPRTLARQSPPLPLDWTSPTPLAASRLNVSPLTRLPRSPGIAAGLLGARPYTEGSLAFCDGSIDSLCQLVSILLCR